MKNNNFPQQQNSLNTSLNKNSSRIQNYNYMFYLYPEVPNLLNIQNIPYSYYPIGLTPTFPQSQYLDIFNNTQNTLPLYYALGLNNLLQLSLLNYNQTLPQNPQIIPNIPNRYNYPNMYQNNFLLNKKTTNPEHKIIENDNTNKIKKISVSNTNSNEEENNENSLEKPEDKETFAIKSDLNVETNSEIKSFGEDLDKNMIKEENNNKENFEKNKDKNELSFSIAKEKINENKKEEIKEKKIKKKRTNYKELLYDPILEHIGREDKPNTNKNNEFEEMSSISENSKKNEKNEKNKKVSSTNTNKNKQKSRTKTGKHSRKKQHKITLKNNKDILADLEENKNNQYNTKYTKVIFHGQNYQETKNVNEFMKYNFDFITDEQYKTKKLITDYSQQHIDVKTLNGNTNIYDNYNYSEQHLDEIKNKWSRAKFLGDNKELKKAINIIRDSFNERKIYTNEEKYLDILKKNNYSLNGIDDENK